MVSQNEGILLIFQSSSYNVYPYALVIQISYYFVVVCGVVCVGVLVLILDFGFVVEHLGSVLAMHFRQLENQTLPTRHIGFIA